MVHTRTTIVAVGLVTLLVSGIVASEKEAILTGLQRHFDALQAGDVEEHLQHHLADKSTFPGDGGPLRTFTSLDQQRAFYATLDNLSDTDQEPRDTTVTLFGDAAIVTGYVAVITPNEDGTSRETVYRRTAVLVKQDGQWKEAHLHTSPLIAPE